MAARHVKPLLNWIGEPMSTVVINSYRQATDNWYDGAYAAWQAKGAASLAASYLDLSGNGRDLGVPAGATAPSWNATDGLIKSSYGNVGLDTGVFPTTEYTIIIRFSNFVPHPLFVTPILGLSDGSFSYRIYPFRSVSDNQTTFQNRNSVFTSPGYASGVLAMTNTNAYYNGNSIGLISTPPLTSFTNSIILFGQNVSGVFQGTNATNIQAVGIWPIPLGATTVAEKSAQMAAL